MTWSTTPAQGMGPKYHHLHGLSRPNLLNCTQEEARKLAAADEALTALENCADCLRAVTEHLAPHPDSVVGKNLASAFAVIAKVKGEPHAPTHRA